MSLLWTGENFEEIKAFCDQYEHDIKLDDGQLSFYQRVLDKQIWIKITEDPETWPKDKQECWIQGYKWDTVNTTKTSTFILRDAVFYTNTNTIYDLDRVTHWTPAIRPEFCEA